MILLLSLLLTLRPNRLSSRGSDAHRYNYYLQLHCPRGLKLLVVKYNTKLFHCCNHRSIKNIGNIRYYIVIRFLDYSKTESHRVTFGANDLLELFQSRCLFSELLFRTRCPPVLNDTEPFHSSCSKNSISSVHFRLARPNISSPMKYCLKHISTLALSRHSMKYVS